MKFVTYFLQKSLVILLAIIFASLQGMENPYNQNKHITYRIAEQNDCDVLFAMQDEFTQDDAQRLLVFPQQVRGAILKNNIEKKRLFVAVDESSSKIIGFVKLFLIDDHDELKEILGTELRLGIGAPVVDCMYQIDLEKICEFGSPLKTQDGILNDYDYPLFCSGDSSCLYIYYGGAYTVSSYRSQRINTTLTMFALEHIKACCKNMLDLNKCTFLALAYGQVEANKNQKGMIRLFANFVKSIPIPGYRTEMIVHHLAYRAYKPELVFDEDKKKLVVLSDVEENKGQGNLAIIKVR